VIVTEAPPPGGVYVTEHTSTDATATPAIPHTPRTKPTEMRTIFSLRLLNTLA
jgi:hypothetical protein